MSVSLQHSPVFADYVDGTSARLLRVAVRFEPANTPDRMLITLPEGGDLVWPLRELRLLPDQADQTGLTLTYTDEPLARLFLKDAGLVEMVRTHAGNLNYRSGVENKSRLIKWGLGAVASVALIVFVLVPLMADQLARYLPPEGEKALGDTTFEQIRRVLDESGLAPIGICENAAGIAALNQMQARLDPQADLPYPLEVAVLDHEMVNAFALPGGRIILFRGLIEEAETPEEVAAVLAHEIGHVVGRDPTRDALRSAGSIGVLGLLFGDFAGGTIMLFLANSLINATYSQKAEAAADSYAHGLLLDAGLSPAALASMFNRMLAEYGEDGGFVAHFAAHPKLSERIAASQAAVEGSGDFHPVLSNAQWRDLQGICGGLVEDLDGNSGRIGKSDAGK